MNEFMSKYMALAGGVKDLNTPQSRRPKLSERNDLGDCRLQEGRASFPRRKGDRSVLVSCAPT